MEKKVSGEIGASRDALGRRELPFPVDEVGR